MSAFDRPLGAQISHALKARGVRVIFGIPGVHNIELYRGIEQAGLIHVLARHEQGAGFMADGYARATGKPGVAYVITGPGVCNIMTAMGQASSDCVPLLVVSSCLDDAAGRRGQLHQMRDQAGAAATVCAWSHEARDADSAYRLIDRALAEFLTARPGARHIQVPINVLGAPARAAPDAAMLSHLCPPHASPDTIAAVATAFAQAKRPLIILGGGARQAAKEAQIVLQKTGAGVFTTFAGRGIVAPDHAQFFGATLPRPPSKQILAEADLVLAVGTQLAEGDLWRVDLGHDCPLIRVDIAPIALDHPRPSMGILSDSKAFLGALAQVLPDAKPCSWRPKTIAAHRAECLAMTDADCPGIVPLCRALQAALPPDVTIYSDMTQFAYVAQEVWDMPTPGQWHHPTGFGTLGYALPAAIGGKLGLGVQPVAAIAGDYGFHYTMQELGVAVELNLTLPIFLWDNGKLKEIEDSMRASQIAPNAVVARNPDFCKLAEAFGAHATRPSSLAELALATQKAFDADGPTLIHMTPDILAP